MPDMTGGLSLQQSPPFSVPARFFVTAPLFGIAAALILLFSGNSVLLSRWDFHLLAVTHCLVLGFFATIMIGSVQQILPVVVGVTISRPERVAGLIHLQWVPGIALLVAGFVYFSPPLFYISLLLITGAIFTFALPVFVSLRQAAAGNEAVPGIKLALSALLVTYLLGVILVFGYGGLMPLFRPSVTDLHLSWGLTGWIAGLIMTVAWQVVPMFQITAPYPGWLRRITVPAILLSLIAKLLLTPMGPGPLRTWAMAVPDLVIAAVLLCFAVSTLLLQLRTKRRLREDVHRDFWRLGMTNLIVSISLWLAALATGHQILYLLAAVVFLLGFAMAVVSGMLLKIIAFLIWLHLQGQRDRIAPEKKTNIKVPRMQAIIPTRSGKTLLWSLTAAEAILIGAFLWPVALSFWAGLAWLLFFTVMLLIIVQAIAMYRGHTNVTS